MTTSKRSSSSAKSGSDEESLNNLEQIKLNHEQRGEYHMAKRIQLIIDRVKALRKNKSKRS